MRVVPVPCLKDNYAYLVICEKTRAAAVVNPSEADPVLAAVRREQVTLKTIWNTHHHYDHTGGNKGLLDTHAELEVVAHASDRGRIPGQTTFAEEGDRVTVGDEVSGSIVFNPGHTSGAISYFVESEPLVFTGDTLFGAGCGRLFEGTPEQMHTSLSKLGALPTATRVYCGHEYTVSNLRFAAAVEPNNPEVTRRMSEAEAARAKGLPTVPSTVADERATNPFLRAAVEVVQEAVQTNEPPKDDTVVEIFAALRRWKDRF